MVYPLVVVLLLRPARALVVVLELLLRPARALVVVPLVVDQVPLVVVQVVSKPDLAVLLVAPSHPLPATRLGL